MNQEQKPVEAIVEKIAKECEEADAGKWTIAKIIKELNSSGIEDPKKMRAKALELLKQLEPKAAEIFASFQRMLVRTSKLEIEQFDRGNIIKSLLKETNATRIVAEKIGREVEDKIKDLQIEYLNTSLIRELVNVRLLEYGHETIRSQYTRTGLPVFEIGKKIEKWPYSNREMLTEYTLLKIIPKELSDLHLSSDIFIAGLSDFCTKPLAGFVKIEKKENIKKTVFENLKKINSLQKFFSWKLNISEANLALASLIEKKQAEETAEYFAYALSCLGPGKNGCLNMNLFVPETEDLEIDNETAIITANKLLEKTRKLSIALKPVFLIDTKYKLGLINPRESRKTGFVNCKKEYFQGINGIASETGISFYAGLNLLKQASPNNPEKMLERAFELAEKTKKLETLKAAELDKREYLKKAGIETQKMRPVFGVYGLMASCRRALQEQTQKNIFELAEKTILGIKKTLGEKWTVSELALEKGIKRFEHENRRQLQTEPRADTTKYLLKAGLQKHMFFKADAKNKPGFEKLMDENIAWIRFKP